MSKKIKLLLLGLVLLLSVLTIGVIAWYAFAVRSDTAKQELAQQLFAKREYQRARPLLQELIVKNNADEAAYRMLGAICEEEGNFLGAAYCYRFASSLAPLDKEQRLKYISVLSLLEDYPRILELLKKESADKSLSGAELFYFLEAKAGTTNGLSPAQLDSVGAGHPGEKLYLQGVIALRNNKLENAIRDFARVVPDQLPGYTRYKMTLFSAAAKISLGRDAAGEQELLTLADSMPSLGAFPLADFYVRKGELAKALPWLEKNWSSGLFHLPTALLLGELYIAEKQPDKLAAMLKTFQPRNKDEIELRNYWEALLAFQERKWQETLDYLDLAPHFENRIVYEGVKFSSLVMLRKTGQLAPVVDMLNKMTSSDTGRQELVRQLLPLLQELLNTERNDEAAQVAQLILSVTKTKSAIRSFALNVVLADAARRGAYPQMISYATQLLDESPDNPLACLALGDALLATGVTAESLHYFNRLPKDNVGGMLGRAMAYSALGEKNNAEHWYQLAWNANPGDLMTFRNYAGLLLDGGKYAALTPLYAKLPDTPEARYWKNFYEAAALERQNQNADLKPFRLAMLEALAKMPANYANRYQAAYLHAVLGQDAEAAKIYRELQKINPNDFMVTVNLSEVEAALGNRHDALLLAEKALRLEPKSEIAKQCLARRRQELGAGQK